MPDTTEDTVGREERLTALFTRLQQVPQLGKVGQDDFNKLSSEYALMKLYAMGLEEKLTDALTTLSAELMEKEEEHDATDEETRHDG